MRHPWGMGAAVACAVLALPSASHAQSTPDKRIDVQLFDYSIGPKSFFTVDNGDLAAPKTLSLDFLVTYMTNPFSVYSSSGPNNTMIVDSSNPRANVVKSLIGGQLTGAYGISDSLQLGANLPIVFRMTGDGIDTSTGMPSPSGLSVTGLGDLVVEGKLRLYRKNRLHLAAIGGVGIPTGVGSDGSQFVGDKLPTVRARVALDYGTGKLTFGANGGVLLRDPQEFYGTTVGQQLTYGAGAAVAVTDRFSVIGELYGRMGIQSFSQNNSPIEAVGGIRVGIAEAIAVVVGGGAGLDHAIGAPQARAFASVSYVPGMYKEVKVTNTCETSPEGCGQITDDRDHDGIKDSEDKCPDQAEDHDGFEDDDGCPDLDNDKDGIPDLQDKCPNDPEDGKEPAPHDGCPATKHDADGDGIPDAYDECPTQEEDFDNFEDGDGCPDLDNDKDGVPDAADKCPVCPEDKDGFQDSDGCPDLDNDRDGIPDSQDKCPNEPETVNGYKDDDGCPDTGGAVVVHLDGDRLTVDKLPDMQGYRLSSSGAVIAEEMALVMRGASVDAPVGTIVVTKWLLAVSAATKADAQRTGDALKAYLAKRGVTVDVLAAQGPAKLGGVVQERSEPDAAFVCPAGLEVKPRPEKQPKAARTEAAMAPTAPVKATDTDKDKDGVPDSVDECPDKAGPAENNGCPDIDTDGDGIVDRLDNCPNEKGTAENQGCAAKQLVKIEGDKLEILDSVFFQTAKAIIDKRSYPLLDNVASVMTSHEKLKVQVEGHTDNQGVAAANKKLSQSRADAVVTYLVGKGIAKDRLVGVGFGQDQPIADNKTADGRAKNRRVVFKILSKDEAAKIKTAPPPPAAEPEIEMGN